MELEKRLAARNKQLDEVKDLQKLTERLVTQLDRFATEMSKIDDSAADVAQLTDNWNQIVRAIGLAANSMVTLKEEDYDEGHPQTERLVRCKLDGAGKIKHK